MAYSMAIKNEAAILLQHQGNFEKKNYTRHGNTVSQRRTNRISKFVIISVEKTGLTQFIFK